MTEQRVRELLGEVADAVPPPDLAERAWRKSVRVRRRRVAGAAVLAVGAIVAAVGVAGFINDGTGTIPRPDGDRHSDPVAKPAPPAVAFARPADARVAGAPAWIGPTIEEEARLPYAGSDLPQTIDLAADDIETTDQPGQAVAAFAASGSEPLESVLLVGPDGEVSSLPTPDLGPVYDRKGESVLPLNISSLSPDGKRLVLAQDHEVVVYDLVEGGSERWPTGDFESFYVGWTETEEYGLQVQLVEDLVDPETGDTHNVVTSGGTESAPPDTQFPVDEAIYPERIDAGGGREAQTGYGPSIPSLGDTLSDPVYVTVDGDRPALLVLPTVDAGPVHISPRSRVVAWFGDVVAFQSQDHGTYRILSWDTSSGAVRRLSEAELPADWDDGVTASWADVSTD
jgi:hypothetical protein